MSLVRGTEKIASPLQESALNKKGLCDYVINVASGCLHGCTFCYVPSTPAIRTKQKQLKEKGVSNPQLDWGEYLFIREGIPDLLEQTLRRKRTWHKTQSGKGIVLLCSGTDPYQNKQTAEITRKIVEILLNHNKRVRILTRGLLWLDDLDILVHPNVTVGVSLPHLYDELSRQIEPRSPLPTERYKALQEAYRANCRLYVAMAPTPPNLGLDDFKYYLDKIKLIEPEVIFWEPINARGTNGKRMIAAGLDFARSIMSKNSWAECFVRQWKEVEEAARYADCAEHLHIWPDPELKGYVNMADLEYWWHRPTVEQWNDTTS